MRFGEPDPASPRRGGTFEVREPTAKRDEPRMETKTDGSPFVRRRHGMMAPGSAGVPPAKFLAQPLPFPPPGSTGNSAMALLRLGRCGSRRQSGWLRHRGESERQPAGEDACGTPATEPIHREGPFIQHRCTGSSSREVAEREADSCDDRVRISGGTPHAFRRTEPRIQTFCPKQHGCPGLQAGRFQNESRASCASM